MIGGMIGCLLPYNVTIKPRNLTIKDRNYVNSAASAWRRQSVYTLLDQNIRESRRSAGRATKPDCRVEVAFPNCRPPME